MAKLVLLDEIHLTFRVPASLPSAQIQSIRRVLRSQALQTRLRRGLAAMIRRHRALKPLRLVISY